MTGVNWSCSGWFVLVDFNLGFLLSFVFVLFACLFSNSSSNVVVDDELNFQAFVGQPPDLTSNVPRLFDHGINMEPVQQLPVAISGVFIDNIV